MRIVAGSARGRRIEAPSGQATRPTSDRTREALFSAIESQRGVLAGARVLDLYAGSGAVGLEAASRGAAHVVLVESEAAAARVARRNVEHLALRQVHLTTTTVERWVEQTDPDPEPDQTFDVVFADPPYSLAPDRLREVLTGLLDRAVLAPQALVVVERSSRDAAWTWPQGLSALRDRRYGEATLWYGRAAAGRTGTEPGAPGDSATGQSAAGHSPAGEDQ